MNFLFTTDGALVALPLERREKVTVAREWGGAGPLMVPSEQLAPIVENSAAHVDPDNRPLTEEEEGRLAWLGVELQPMTPDLARMNGISHLTNGGATGALVTYVYAGSPAARAGIALGDVLLRLHVEGQPKPLEVSIEDSSFGGEFPWDYFDQVPPEFFSQLPAPWGSVDNRLNRALTELGFGTPFAAAIFRGGETLRLECFVTEGPRHFESAPRFKSEDLGLTVRDLTYEVRRYFQVEEGEPGVIISKVEPGEKAAIAGLRPFELVLSINDAPVRTSEEFRTAVAAAGPLRLFVKRMTDGRTVTLTAEGE
jgi:S1-C subfamily serine protease